MKMILLMLFSMTLLYSGDVAIVTVPKAGTHLIQKLLKLSKGEYPIYHVDEFYENEALVKQYPRRILLVRDPRDVCLSWIRYVVSGQANQVDGNIRNLPDEVKEHWAHLGLEQQLEFVIRGNSRQSQKAGVHPTLIYFPLIPYHIASEHAEDPNTLVIKFEHLVGEKGGGNRQQQREAATQIFSFLGIEIEEERRDQILEELFGGTATFSKGKIGGWKTSFSRKNQKLFKKRHEGLLRTFSYPR